MSQLDLVVDAECFVASTYALDVRIAKPLLNGRFFTIVQRDSAVEVSMPTRSHVRLRAARVGVDKCFKVVGGTFLGSWRAAVGPPPPPPPPPPGAARAASFGMLPAPTAAQA